MSSFDSGTLNVGSLGFPASGYTLGVDTSGNVYCTNNTSGAKSTVYMTYLNSLTTGTFFVGYSYAMTAVFSCPLTTTPTITPPGASDTVSSIVLSSATVTFTWAVKTVVSGTPFTFLIEMNKITSSNYTTIGNLIGDYDASNGSSLNTTTNGANVTSWANTMTGYALGTLTTSPSGHQPIYKSSLSIFNNNPGILWQNSNSNCLIQTAYQSTSWPVTSSNFTLFVVFNQTSDGNNDVLVSGYNMPTSCAKLAYFGPSGAFGSWSGTAMTATTTDTLSFGTSYIYILICTSTTTECRLNNLHSSGVQSVVTNPGTDMSVGGVSSMAYYCFNGYIGEIMLFSTNLSSSSITAVTNFLATKWGVTLN